MKTLNSFTLSAVFAALCFTSGAAGQQAAPRKPIFLSPDQLDLTKILPAPAPEGSAKALAELAEVHRLQETRNADLIAHARADDAEEDMFVFRNVLGDRFRAEALPQTLLLSTHLHNDEGIFGNVAKNRFQRLRPFNFDNTVKPVCKTNANVKDYGYPSGHALTGYLEALALVQMVPEKREAILARADDYAESRVVCGVHYPADAVASKLAAYSMMSLMMNNTQFRAELEAARAEVRRMLGL